MNCYLAGWQSGTLEREVRLIKAGVFKHRCFSFANVIEVPGLPWHLPGVEAGYKLCQKNSIGIMMDSGVYSFRTYRAYLERTGKSTSSLPDDAGYIQLYVDFCKKHAKNWDFYVTVDFTRNCAANLKIHQKLEKMGVRPVPVFHGDDSIDYLKRYADRGYDYICVGNLPRRQRTGVGAKRRYLDLVFNAAEKLKLTCHGLGMTSPWIMIDYPWRSVDSSSWARVAGFGSILGWDERTRRITTLHISDKQSAASRIQNNANALQQIREHVLADGYDFDLLRTDHIYRHQFNAFTMLKLAEYAGKQHRTRWRSLV